MPDINDAKNAVKQLQNNFGRHLSNLSSALEEIGSLDQATNESRQRLELAKTEADRMLDKCAQYRKQAEEIAANNKVLLDAAAVEAKRLVDGARVQADAMVSTAKQSVENMKAKESADSTLRLAAMNAKLDDVQKQVMKGQKTVADLDDVIVQKRNEASDLETRIAKARAEIARLVA